MTTLEEVAKLSGVSRATASRALSGDARVKDGTRSRVRAVADSVGYRPNRAARSLASGRSGVIGLVLPSEHLAEDPYGALLIKGLSRAAAERDQGLMLWMTHHEPGTTVREIFSGGIVDGVVIAATALDDVWVERLIDSDIPTVLVGQHPSRDDVNAVDLDNLAGARLVVEHLVSLGHTRIGTITGPLERSDAAERLEGYRQVMNEHRLETPVELVAHSDFSIDGGLAAMARMLPFRPTAVFCANDEMAFGAIEAVRLAGLDVPDDISIAGFDDFPKSKFFALPLTSVGQDIGALTSRAVDRLLEIIENPSAPAERVVLPATLAARASTMAI